MDFKQFLGYKTVNITWRNGAEETIRVVSSVRYPEVDVFLHISLLKCHHDTIDIVSVNELENGCNC